MATIICLNLQTQYKVIANSLFAFNSQWNVIEELDFIVCLLPGYTFAFQTFIIYVLQTHFRDRHFEALVGYYPLPFKINVLLIHFRNRHSEASTFATGRAFRFWKRKKPRLTRTKNRAKTTTTEERRTIDVIARQTSNVEKKILKENFSMFCFRSKDMVTHFLSPSF